MFAHSVVYWMISFAMGNLLLDRYYLAVLVDGVAVATMAISLVMLILAATVADNCCEIDIDNSDFVVERDGSVDVVAGTKQLVAQAERMVYFYSVGHHHHLDHTANY